MPSARVRRRASRRAGRNPPVRRLASRRWRPGYLRQPARAARGLRHPTASDDRTYQRTKVYYGFALVQGGPFYPKAAAIVSLHTGGHNSAPTQWNLVNAIAALESAERSADSLERKVGQFILSAAFFLTAAVALLNINEIRDFRFMFNKHLALALPLDGIIVFIGLTFVSVIHLVMALGLQRKPRRQDDPPGASYVAWWKILDVSSADWSKLFTDTSARQFNQEQLTQTIYAARYMARTANYMYARVVEARAYFFLAVTALLTSTPSIAVALQVKPAPSHAWSYFDAVAYALVVTFALWLAGNDRFRLEADVDTLRDQRSPIRLFGPLAVLLALSSGAAVMATKGSWLAFATSELFLLASSACIYRFGRSEHHSMLFDRIPLLKLLPILAMAIEFPLFLPPLLRPWLLLFSYWPIFFYEGIRLFDNMLHRKAIVRSSEIGIRSEEEKVESDRRH
jgi:hypothetical protein